MFRYVPVPKEKYELLTPEDRMYLLTKGAIVSEVYDEGEDLRQFVHPSGAIFAKEVVSGGKRILAYLTR